MNAHDTLCCWVKNSVVTLPYKQPSFLKINPKTPLNLDKKRKTWNASGPTHRESVSKFSGKEQLPIWEAIILKGFTVVKRHPYCFTSQYRSNHYQQN